MHLLQPIGKPCLWLSHQWPPWHACCAGVGRQVVTLVRVQLQCPWYTRLVALLAGAAKPASHPNLVQHLCTLMWHGSESCSLHQVAVVKHRYA